MALTSDPRLTPILIAAVAILVGYMGYTGTGIRSLGVMGVQERKDSLARMEHSLDSLEARTDSAKKILAKSSMEDLHHRLDGYRFSLELMRRLVPDRNEVPNLMDEISTRAKIRGVAISQFVPLPVQSGPAPFNSYRYQYSILGHYDQIGEFLSDVATLQRIIVPIDLTLVAANQGAAKALGDTTGSLLEAKFQVRTYVKTPGTEGDASGI
ncbi:MAG: type 4a pilus biogenesis protein PilO [Gemmatimonadales bacterium]